MKWDPFFDLIGLSGAKWRPLPELTASLLNTLGGDPMRLTKKSKNTRFSLDSVVE